MNTILQQIVQCMTKGRTMKSNRALALAVAVTCLLPATGSATVVCLDDLNLPHSGDASIYLGQWVASRFTTGTNAPAFQLDSVTFGRIYASTPGGNFVASIYACNGGAGNETVGTLVGNLSGASSPNTQDAYTYTSTAINLQTNTSYWIVARVTSGSADYRVSYCRDSYNSVTSGWSFASTRVWSYSSTQGTTWGPPGDLYPYRYEVEATGVPEPGAALILSVIVLGATGLRRLT